MSFRESETAALGTLPLSLPALTRSGLRRRLLLVALVGAALLVVWRQWAGYAVHRPRAEAFLAALHVDPVVIEAVRRQNRALAGMSTAELHRLDEAWVAERSGGGGAAVAAMLALPASRHIAALVAATGGTVRHLIVMDDRGRNVAIAAPTSDYWQGDEAKWSETFGRPRGTRHRARPERGHEGWFVACWVSEPLADPASGEPLGAIAMEIDAWRVSGLCGS